MFRAVPYLILLVIALLVLACGGSKKAPALSDQALANATYDLRGPPPVTLHDGKFAVTPTPQTQVVSADLVKVARGDIDGDGTEDAAVVVVWSGGGSGHFYELIAMRNDKGVPKQIATTPLGDRIKLNSLAIANKAIAVDMITQGPKDGACCPTLPLKASFVLKGGKLEEAP